MNLPEIIQVQLPDCNFPTLWQAVVFRNYGIVSTERIASVLGCDAQTVIIEAERLGIGDTKYEPLYEKLGYITIIRNNWFLLPYSQLEALLGFSEEKLAFILKEEDFLSVKLANYKPYCDEVKYSPLTAEQIVETERIAKTAASVRISDPVRPFDFYAGIDAKEGAIPSDNGKTRFIHGYRTPCLDPFMENGEDYLPDEILMKYQKEGINGIWIHGILSTLSPYPFDEVISKGYEIRRKNLNALIERAARFGIGIYLYFNEPRGFNFALAKKYPKIVGRQVALMNCLCFSGDEPKRYLYNAVSDLLSECNIKGIITITMSENPTHCTYTGAQNNECPKCRDIPVHVPCVEINNTIQKAIDDTNSACELIVNIWGWDERRGWSVDDVRSAFSSLDPRAAVVVVSEARLAIKKAGIESRVADYSISNPGPSEYIADALSMAAEYGHKTYAKVQVNNSWECSAVPYLPVFDLVMEHLDNLSRIGIENYMLSWTHGGYPSPTLNFISNYKPGYCIDDWYRSYYGENAETVHKAVLRICEGFRYYPFSVSHMYFSPQNIAAGNMWSLSPEKKESAMIGLSFDDLEKWTTIYPYEAFVSETEKMLLLWKEGIDILDGATKTKRVDELLLFSLVAYRHLECDLLQTKYAFMKRDINKYRGELKDLIKSAKENAKALLVLSSKDARVGYEASNHYFYTPNLLKEKLINCDKLLYELENY